MLFSFPLQKLPKKKVQNFIKKYEPEYNIFPDADSLCKALKIRYYPAHYFIDKNGILTELKVEIGVSWRRLDYPEGKPPQTEFKQMLFDQNKDKILEAIGNLNLKSINMP